MTTKRISWAAPGDVNAFFGLMLDNVADLILMVSLLHYVFEFPTDFALCYMVPGTAVGVLVGDGLFFWLALRTARRTSRNDITAMPLGLDTPSTFGMVFFVLGPAFLAAKASGLSEFDAAMHTWQIGICAIFISGLFKFACAGCSNWARRLIPRAGLLGSLAAIALVLICFLPMLEILRHPIVGMVSLAIILTTLVARVPLPFRMPGALGALLVGGGLFYLMRWNGLLAVEAATIDLSTGWLQNKWLTVFRFEWIGVLRESLQYLPIVIPFALGTVVGGIDCTESAAAAGDDFDTNQVIGIEALATTVAALCGGVIQTTPYIGHPAYKAMGGRSAYVLATALFIGAAGLLGFFGMMYAIIPKAIVFPILVFIGIEITAQSFRSTPKRHYPAVALACIPALAALAMLFVDKIFGDKNICDLGVNMSILKDEFVNELIVLRTMSSGFIVISLIWAAAMAHLIDRRIYVAARFFAIGAVASLFGIIHSPLPGSPVCFPWQVGEAIELLADTRDIVLPAGTAQLPIRFAVGYALVAGLLLLWGRWLKSQEGRDDGAMKQPEENR